MGATIFKVGRDCCQCLALASAPPRGLRRLKDGSCECYQRDGVGRRVCFYGSLRASQRGALQRDVRDLPTYKLRQRGKPWPRSTVYSTLFPLSHYKWIIGL